MMKKGTAATRMYIFTAFQFACMCERDTVLNHDRFNLLWIAIEDWTDDTLNGYIVYTIFIVQDWARRKCALACN